MTYEDFLKRAVALLDQKPNMTALQCGAGDMVLVHGAQPENSYLMAIPHGDGIDDAYDIDESDWDGEAWDGMTAADVEDALSNPVFSDRFVTGAACQ